MALFSAGTGKKINGQCVVAYRLQNSKAVESKDVSDEVFFTVLPEDITVISSIFLSLMKSIKPALGASKDYGNCSETSKLNFIYGVDQFVGLLKSRRTAFLLCLDFTFNFVLR